MQSTLSLVSLVFEPMCWMYGRDVLIPVKSWYVWAFTVILFLITACTSFWKIPYIPLTGVFILLWRFQFNKNQDCFTLDEVPLDVGTYFWPIECIILNFYVPWMEFRASCVCPVCLSVRSSVGVNNLNLGQNFFWYQRSKVCLSVLPSVCLCLSVALRFCWCLMLSTEL